MSRIVNDVWVRDCSSIAGDNSPEGSETMFETEYNDEMIAEVLRLEGKQRARAAGHPEWDNACAGCGCELAAGDDKCSRCSPHDQ